MERQKVPGMTEVPITQSVTRWLALGLAALKMPAGLYKLEAIHSPV
jgi:hypothetical protein